MRDDISDIQAMYDAQAATEDSRLLHHQLEYDLTLRHLRAYLPPAGHLLEVGSASGRYTLALAAVGYRLTTFDLSAALTALARQRLAAAGVLDRVTQVIGDARDLSALLGRVFDAILLMGPLYHLIHLEERQALLAQAFDLLRPGGIICSAFISRFGIMGDLMRNLPDWAENRHAVRAVLDRGRDPEDWPRGGFRGYFARIEEITPLHASVGFHTVQLVAVEPAISADDESYNCLEGTRRQAWLDLLYEISAEPSIVGASRHVLYIGQKPG